MELGKGSVARRARLASIVLIGALAVPAIASAHLERPSYWPDPAAEMADGVPAGGEVPKARSMATAVNGNGKGDVRVVCQRNSLKLALKSISSAERKGFRIRPSQPSKRISAAKARFLEKANRKFAKQCEFSSVQEAVNASGNNDRVIVMPGLYKEKASRSAPTNDPDCDPSLLQQDQTASDNGDPANTPSYEYQATCPNDQNLIYVQGRAVKGDPLASPDPDRHGIPEQELGKCVRCNLQIDGSGARPEDVIFDAGKEYAGFQRDPEAEPGLNVDDCSADPTTSISPCYAKHVVLRTDRSDGFVGRNFTMRGALEHGFYTEETDGVMLNKVKFFWNADYGHLSFTTDHNVVKNCDGFGSGDAVVYPGASPQTGEFRDTNVYPQMRYNTVIKKCDLHGSTMGYSGSMGNSVRVTQNNFYGNANGLTSDTLSAAGHPGYPADGMKIDNNRFYSNNLNLYVEDPPVKPLVPQPVGSGMLWAGYNNGEVSNNYFFDNWRYGAVLHFVPDSVAGKPEGNVDPQSHCAPATGGDPFGASTSCDNRFFGNKMGQVPPGFKKHPALTKFGNKTTLAKGVKVAENGEDFWWDEWPASTGNCWYDNEGADGGEPTAGAGSPPDILPGEANCDSTTPGLTADGAKIGMLLDCAEWDRGETGEDFVLCPWFDEPERPGSSAARSESREWQQASRDYLDTAEGQRLLDVIDEFTRNPDGS